MTEEKQQPDLNIPSLGENVSPGETRETQPELEVSVPERPSIDTEEDTEVRSEISIGSQELGPAPSDQPIMAPVSKPKNPRLIFIIAGLVILLLLGALLFKLFSGRKKSGPAVTLTYWGLWEPEPVIQGILAEWEKENPGIKINYIKQDKEDYRARLQSAFSRGDGPDIFRFHNTWVPILKNELTSLPINVVASLGLEKDYFPIVVDSLSSNQQFYGIPLMVDGLALYYNKDLLSAANKSLPKTWWGLERVAKELTVRPSGKISIAGVALGTTSNVDHWSDVIGLMIYQNDGDPAKPDSLVEDVLKYYLKFKNDDRVWDETLPSSTMAFANGRLVFYFAPSWRVFNLLEANPNLNFGITNVPQLPKLKEVDWEAAEKGEKELTDIGWATFWAEGVWSKSEYQEEAWKFLEFLGSKETLQRLYTAQSQIRLFGEIYPRIDLSNSLTSDPLIKPFVDEVKNSKSWYLSSFTHDAGGINERIIKYYEDAINGLDQGDQEKKVMETLTNGINQILGQYSVSSY